MNTQKVGALIRKRVPDTDERGVAQIDAFNLPAVA